MKLDDSIRNDTKLIGEKLKNLLPNKELSDRYVEFFENPKQHLAFCAVIFFLCLNENIFLIKIFY